MAKKQTTDEPTLQPLADRVLVLPDLREETKTAAGILIPGTTSDNLTGVVVAVGPGRTLDNGDFAAVGVTYGDRVLIGKYGHEEIMYEGKKYFIVPESSLLAIIG